MNKIKVSSKTNSFRGLTHTAANMARRSARFYGVGLAGGGARCLSGQK